MPIPDDLQDAYPDDWEAIREEVLERATFTSPVLSDPVPCCEWCGKPNEYPCKHTDSGWRMWYEETLDGVRQTVAAEFSDNGRASTHPGQPIVESAPDEVPDDATKVVLTVAHLCQDPRCGDLGHLRALCQRCHLQYDAQPEKRQKRKRIQAEIRGQQSIVDPAGCEQVVGGAA